MVRRPTASRPQKGPGDPASPGEFDAVFARIRVAIPSIETQRDLADLLDIRQSSVSDAKRRQVIPGEWAIKLFRSHQINPLWIYEGLDPVRISGQPGTPGTESQPVTESFLLRYNPHKIMAVRVEDPSMEPAINRDAHVGVNTGDRTLSSDTLYAFNLPPEGITLRRVFLDIPGKRIEMRAERPGIPHVHIPLSEARRHLLGRVVWVMQAPGPCTRPGNPEDKRLKFD